MNLYDLLIDAGGNIKTGTNINNTPDAQSLYTGFYNNPASIPAICSLFVPFSKLVFKGCGDLFQEINAVCVHGGYKIGVDYQSYFKDDTQHTQMIQWKSERNLQRLVLSNDRPSAARAMIMLACATDGVNASGQAGYLPPGGDMYAIQQLSVDVGPNRSKGAKGKKRAKKGGGGTRHRSVRAKQTRRMPDRPGRGGSLNTRKRRVGHKRTRRSIH